MGLHYDHIIFLFYNLHNLSLSGPTVNTTTRTLGAVRVMAWNLYTKTQECLVLRKQRGRGSQHWMQNLIDPSSNPSPASH